MGAAPSPWIFARKSASASSLLVSALIRSTTTGGTPCGATTANQTDDFRFFMPCSTVVGTSGRPGQRFSDNTAIGRTRSAFTCAWMPVMSWNMSWVRPEIRSRVASAGTL